MADKIIQEFNLVDEERETVNFDNPMRGRVYNPIGICPTLNCMQGGGLKPQIIVCNESIGHIGMGKGQ